jgi:hypothetical protein
LDVYILGAEVRPCASNSIKGIIQYEDTLIPKLGPAWKMVVQHKQSLAAVSAALLKHKIEGLPLLEPYRPIVSTDLSYAAVQGYQWRDDGVDLKMIRANMDILLKKYPDELFTIYGPQKELSYEDFDKRCTVKECANLYDKDGEVLGIWSATNTGSEVCKVLQSINIPVKHMLVDITTTDGVGAAWYCCTNSIPYSVLKSNKVATSIWHWAADEMIDSPECTLPVYERSTSVLCLVEDEDQIPPAFLHQHVNPLMRVFTPNGEINVKIV